MPSTKTPIQLTSDIFEDFKDKPQMGVVDKKTGMMFYPIKYTSEGFADDLWLKATWNKYAPNEKFIPWYEKNEISDFAIQHNLKFKAPSCFSDIPDLGYRRKLKEDWEREFKITGVQFEAWFKSHRRKPLLIQIPDDESSSSNSSNEGEADLDQKDNFQASSSSTKTTEKRTDGQAGPRTTELNMDSKFEAYTLLTSAPKEERKEMEEYFTI